MQKKRRSAPRAGPERPAVANQLRIIGGEWRGRRLRLAPGALIRPTPDRVRETVFNWLQPAIRDARCLDLFAGSGALGLEALSRGAREVVFVDQDARAIRQIRATLEEFGIAAPRVQVSDALRFLRQAPSPFDIVFLDPPFATGLLAPACAMLEEQPWLAEEALVYLEAPSRDAPPPLPARWRLLKAKKAGEVGYYLARRDVERRATDKLTRGEVPSVP
jgi:16S rRNA (guanine966-N2)-methyltransferase